MQAPAPERLIKGGLPTEAMVASVLVAKYAWHLPLYRQAQMLAAPRPRHRPLDAWRSGSAMRRPSCMPLYERLRELTPDLGQARGRRDAGAGARSRPRRTKTGYFWAIARDDRPWGGSDPPAVAYSYAPGRGVRSILKLLA